MRLFRSLILFAVTSMSVMSLAAQEGSTTPAPSRPEMPEATVIPVKTLTGDSFNRLVKLLSVFNARFTSDDKLRIIVIYAPKDVVAQMRRVITDLDRPGSDAAIGKNIEMNMSFLKCSTKQAAASQLSPELEAVAKQLRAATQCKAVDLWETFPLQLQEGKNTDHNARIPVALPDFPGAAANLYLKILPESIVTKSTGRYVRFERMQINLRVPVVTSKTQMQYQEVGFNTSGEFKEGQKAVLGKLSGVEDDSVLFVVISMKVVD